MPVLAYHGDKKLKERFVAEMKWHREQDMILQGSTGEGEGLEWKGCCIACGVHSMSRISGEKYRPYDHKLWETLIGIPEWMAHLCESIFEGLPESEAKEFPVQFAEAVKCGADLDLLKPAFSIFVLESVRENASDDGKAAVDQVISLWRRVEAGGKVSVGEWSAAWSAARSAAESAVRSAAWSAARSAAVWSAGWSAAASSASSAWSAASAAAWSAGWSAGWSAAASSAESAASAAAWSAGWSAAASSASSAWSAWSAARSAAWKKFRDELLRLVGGGAK